MRQCFFIFIMICTNYVCGQSNISKIKASTLKNTEIALKDFISKDKYTLLSIGGSWCKPCIMQKPFVASLEKQYPQYLKVIYLFARDTPEKVMSKFGVANNSETYFLIDKKANSLLKIKTYPTNILVNAKGKIIKHDISINDVGKYVK